MTRLLAALACAALFVGCGGGDGETAAPAWNHDPGDGELGPAAWGEIDESFEQCPTGRKQSPVDLSDDVAADLPELRFDYPPAPLVVENTGHVIEVPMPEDGGQRLTIDGEEYRLVQYHFHSPSEHTVDGRSYDAEAHLVHASDEGELAVVGILLDEGRQVSALVDLILGNAPGEAGDEREIEAVDEHSPLSLLGLDGTVGVVTSYETYPGSLTTPPCTEGVRWIVLSDPLTISSAAATGLHRLVGAFPEYDGHESNNRPLQPLNNRVIERDAG